MKIKVYSEYSSNGERLKEFLRPKKDGYGIDEVYMGMVILGYTQSEEYRDIEDLYIRLCRARSEVDVSAVSEILHELSRKVREKFGIEIKTP